MRLRIVIADDHPVVRIGTRAIIEGSGTGTVVAEAEDVATLLRVLEDVPCDVLVTDLSMPAGDRADGVVMIGGIRKRFPTLPIVVLTTTTNLAILRLILAAGVAGLLGKHSSLEELPTAICAAFHKRSYISVEIRQRLAELDPANAHAMGKLSPRETEVVRLLASGLTVGQIAARLHRSVATISRQKTSAMHRLGVSNDAELFAFLQQQGLS